MEAHARKLERIFDSTVTYQIPLFQRPYVWTEDKNWCHLWDDIVDVTNQHGERHGFTKSATESKH